MGNPDSSFRLAPIQPYSRSVPSRVENERVGTTFMQTPSVKANSKYSEIDKAFQKLSFYMGYFLRPNDNVHGTNIIVSGKPKILLKDYVKDMTVYHELTHYLLYQERQESGKSEPTDQMEINLLVIGEELDNYKNLFEMRDELGLSRDEALHQVLSHRKQLGQMDIFLEENRSALGSRYDDLRQKFKKSLEFQIHAESLMGLS